MELRILAPILLGLASLGIIIFAELRLSRRPRIFCVLFASFTLAFSVWDFGELHRQHDTHFLRFDTGQAFFAINEMLIDGRAADVRSVLSKPGKNWLAAPSSQDIHTASQELITRWSASAR